MAERLRKAVRAMTIEHRGNTFAVTVCVGVASLVPGETAAAWIERADQALYVAKNDGRDRVEVWRAPRGVRLNSRSAIPIRPARLGDRSNELIDAGCNDVPSSDTQRVAVEQCAPQPLAGYICTHRVHPRRLANYTTGELS